MIGITIKITTPNALIHLEKYSWGNPPRLSAVMIAVMMKDMIVPMIEALMIGANFLRQNNDVVDHDIKGRLYESKNSISFAIGFGRSI